MERGAFDSFLGNEAYENSNKEWYVELQVVRMIWYGLSTEPYKKHNTKKIIKEHIADIKRQIESCLEKRFIYFICSRKKVRFSTNRKPRYNLFGTKITLFLEVGGQKELKKITIPVHGGNFQNKQSIEVDGRFISFTNRMGGGLVISIHDFLLNRNMDFGIQTQVHYVGFTKNPHTRPLNGRHTGLNDVLRRISSEDNDILIYFNVFKVTSVADNSKYMVKFAIANSMIDEIETDEEGKIIEKCFIAYFDAKNQYRNKSKEMSELRNRLIKLANRNHIKSIQIQYELAEKNEYYEFYSTNVAPQEKHIFTVALNGSDFLIKEGSDLYSRHIEAVNF
jgi:hypothetical protein